MSGSDSDDSGVHGGTVPQSAVIEKTLRDIVKNYWRCGRSYDVTVNNIRSAAAQKLKLGNDFFKAGKWKDKSKETIRDQAAEEQTNELSSEAEPPIESGIKKRKSAAKSEAQDSTKQPKTKRRKVSEEAESPGNGYDRPKTNTTSKNGGHEPLSSDEGSSLSDIDDEGAEGSRLTAKKDDENASESELSVLIDDNPPLKISRGKKGSQTAGDADQKPKKTSKAQKDASTITASNATASTATAAVSDPDKEEIKRLQGWLVKCGIRKLWGKELAPFEGNKAKIRRLKEMLSDVGMTGRYSQEKARQIKEQRELAADLEAVQEGDKLWGTRAKEESGNADSGERGDEVGNSEKENNRRRRPLAKGLQELDFISDEESE